MQNCQPKPPVAARQRRTRGFTLIELLTTVTVMTVLAFIAVPSFADIILGHRLAAYANDFVASVHLARSEAIKRNGAVTLCRSANGTACASSGGWQQGWIVLSGTTVIQHQQPLASGYQLTGSVYNIAFQSLGVGTTSAALTLCRVAPAPGGQERAISVSATGRASVSKTQTGVCA